MALLLISGFIIGVLTILAFEVLGLWILIRRLQGKALRDDAKHTETDALSISSATLNPSLTEKQGTLWVLEPDKVPKSGLQDKVPTEQRRRKEIMDVTPVRKYGRIRDHFLILTESDGSSVEISLRGCSSVAVSASSLSSKKWAKKYPIKIESKDSTIYKGHKVIYLYAETSWEKESWCKALRLASCDDEGKIAWFSKLSVEFNCYLTSLNTGYPSFMKPSGGLNADLIDKSVKLDNSSSKVRQFLKKLAKKGSKVGQDGKASVPILGHEERSLSKADTIGKTPNISLDDTSMGSLISASAEPGSRSYSSQTSDADCNHNYFDEGTLCLNVLFSRLFFDAKNNLLVKNSIQDRIQRTLSSMRIPSYIGEVTCTAVDPGNLPPRILAMRVLPSDMNEMWSMEIDIEYLGGMVVGIETRLEIKELEVEGEETHFGTDSAGDEVPSDLLEGFEYLGKQLKLSEEAIDNGTQKDEGSRDTVGEDESGDSKSTVHASSQGSRWKSILHSITKQVSQVPLALGVKVSSLSGTIRMSMKPPPSDQIWFGFTSMPDVQFNLESFVGDHKITNGHLAVFLISRFKAAIRETLVLPNSESVGISWMLAEKDDWIPRKSAPFMWYKNTQDSASNTTKQEVPSSQAGEVPQSVEPNLGNQTKSEANRVKIKNVGRFQVGNLTGPESTQVASESSEHCASSSSSADESTLNDSSLQELGAPLLKKDKQSELGTRSMEDIGVHPSTRFFAGGQGQNSEDEDTRPRKLLTKERMLGLGKKMGEKFEVKRRHFEEKRRSFVERMKGQ